MQRKYSRESLIRDLRTYAARTSGRISVLRFCRECGVGSSTISKYFKDFREFVAGAGLSDRMCKVRSADEAALMLEVDRVARVLGRTPSRQDMKRQGWIRPGAFQRRMGTWAEVLSGYERWKAERGEPMPAGINDPGAQGSPTTGAGMPALRGPDGSPLIVGTPLGFRGLVHAPVNELGVVHLFGLLGPDLGIAVEFIGAGYPDCRGLRAEPGAGGKWRRIAIEFELRSSNFKAHGHDPTLCDLVVCWEHDWKECPVEVMELRAEVARVGRGWGEMRAA